MSNFFFRCKETGHVYKVIKLDKKEGVITLKGEAEFNEPYDPARFKRMGYELVQGAEADAIERQLRT